MDQQRLDYASHEMNSPKPSLTPEQRRFRRRMMIAVLIVIVLSLVPYPTQVIPSVTIQVVDHVGKPVNTIVSAHWQGSAHGVNVEGYTPFDLSGKLSLS